MRTPEEIAAEIAALQALKPQGPWARKTTASIAVAIEALQAGFDVTAEEFQDLTTTQKDVALAAMAWKEGHSTDRPSEGWGDLVASNEPPATPIKPHRPSNNGPNNPTKGKL